MTILKLLDIARLIDVFVMILKAQSNLIYVCMYKRAMLVTNTSSIVEQYIWRWKILKPPEACGLF